MTVTYRYLADFEQVSTDWKDVDFKRRSAVSTISKTKISDESAAPIGKNLFKVNQTRTQSFLVEAWFIFVKEGGRHGIEVLNSLRGDHSVKYFHM